jgi:hypothetical protein
VIAGLAPTLLLALNLTGAPPPRFSAGLTAGVAEVKGGAAEPTKHGTYGLAADYRPFRLAALRLSYLRMSEGHGYGAFQLDTTFHRFTLAPEGRLPLSSRVDFAVAVGPTVTLVHSTLDAPGAGSSRSAAWWSLWTGGGLLYRFWRLEARMDIGVTLGDRAPDLAVAFAVAYSWK